MLIDDYLYHLIMQNQYFIDYLGCKIKFLKEMKMSKFRILVR